MWIVISLIESVRGRRGHNLSWGSQLGFRGLRSRKAHSQNIPAAGACEAGVAATQGAQMRGIFFPPTFQSVELE